jgi:hypothetical protein
MNNFKICLLYKNPQQRRDKSQIRLKPADYSRTQHFHRENKNYTFNKKQIIVL